MTKKLLALSFWLLATAAAQELPKPRLTPGAATHASTATICQPGYSATVRNVSAATKRRVYAAYHRQPKAGVCCEVDHLVSLELGGSNSIRNLWPEPYEPRPGAHEKDQVENYLHRQVCSGAMPLRVAQHAIRSDWYEVFRLINPDAQPRFETRVEIANPPTGWRRIYRSGETGLLTCVRSDGSQCPVPEWVKREASASQF